MHVKRFLYGHHELMFAFGPGEWNFYEDISSRGSNRPKNNNNGRIA